MSLEKRALISGITGQDGSYLAELLLSKGYKVHGIIRRTSTSNTSRIRDILNLITLHEADLLDQSSLVRLVVDIQPNEVYNLAAQSFVPESWKSPLSTSEMTGLGTTRFLESIRIGSKNIADIKFYQASSSEMFGMVQSMPQIESTPFYPRSPYGVSKLYSHWMTINYRESFDMFAVSGILFNHESPRRGLEFVTRKISNAVAKIKLGKQDKLFLGNLDAKRDWGFAGDYVRAMWMMLQQDDPQDYVIATNTIKSVKEFVEAAFDRVSLNWEKYVEIDEKLFRPAEVHVLCGDYTKAKKNIGWEPEVNFEQLVAMMVDSDVVFESK
jgi:GDPmannose 4,6-dehydratase